MEEVEAAGMAKRVSGETDCPPPTDREVEAFQELERAVISGKVLSGESIDLGAATEPARVAWHRMLGSLAAWLDGGIQTTAGLGRRAPATRSAGRVEVCLRMSRGNYALWHAFELAVRRVLRIPMSFLRFLCLVLWKEEQHVIGGATSVMIRDRARCSSPVCCRHDVQAHHVRFRSQGGTDADDNLIDLCFWCHIPGVHERRLTATGVAGRIRWVVGRAALFVVEGRERKAA